MSSVNEFMSIAVEQRSPQHLLDMIGCAIKLEHSTLPPYLTAMWSISDRNHAAYGILATIVMEEMGHMGLACNLLTTLGGSPSITAPDFVPQYPSPLPCDIAPRVIPPNLQTWQVGLSRLTPAVISDIFMIIEYPEGGPIALLDERRRTFYTIGEFYDAIAHTLRHLVNCGKLKITGDRQITEPIGDYNAVTPITNLKEALCVIEHIKEQGEGTPHAPDAVNFGAELAHYYQFKQILVGRLYQQMPDRTWKLNGKFFDFPAVYPMADVPRGGYSGPSVPLELAQFNSDYKQMLVALQAAWDKGGAAGHHNLEEAENYMDGLGTTAVTLMNTPIDAIHPDRGNYAPTFQIQS